MIGMMMNEVSSSNICYTEKSYTLDLLSCFFRSLLAFLGAIGLAYSNFVRGVELVDKIH